MFLIFVCQSKKKFNVNSQIKKIKKPNFSLRKGVGKIGKKWHHQPHAVGGTIVYFKQFQELFLPTTINRLAIALLKAARN